MPSRIASESNLKAVVSISDLARTLGLSRSHFHSLMKSGVMPSPVYCTTTRRPLFTRELQEAALLVRATNIGVDGRYVCFYAARQKDVPQTPSARRQPRTVERHPELMSGLRSLGISDINDGQVTAALSACFPAGTQGTDEGQVLRSVWHHLRRSQGG